MSKTSISRKDFIKRLMDAGFTYIHACQAYEVFTGIIEDAVVSGAKVNIGRVCSISPVWLKSREVNMSFTRTKKGLARTTKTFYLGRRLRYRVNLYPEFVRTHALNWF